MDNRLQRQYYRAQRRAYRQQRRGYYGGGFGGLIVFLIILGAVTHLWVIFPLAFFVLPFLFWVVRPMFFNQMNQPPYQGQPYQQQPEQEQPIYQPYQQQPEPEQPVYQPYSQGYQPQQSAYEPAEAYEERSQPEYQSQQTQQYEEPMTMYPQE